MAELALLVALELALLAHFPQADFLLALEAVDLAGLLQLEMQAQVVQGDSLAAVEEVVGLHWMQLEILEQVDQVELEQLL